MDVTSLSQRQYTWSQDIVLPQLRARNLALTAEAYGVSEEAFRRGLEHVYRGNIHKLNTIEETFYYYPKAYPRSKYGYNFPAAMNEFSLVGYSIDDAFLWTLLAFRYSVSLDDIKDVLFQYDFVQVCNLYDAGYDHNVVMNMLENDIDANIIYAVLSS